MMEGWQGRIDSTEDAAAFRWHQVVHPVEIAASPGIALVGFACDEGVQRNGGRAGAALGPAALRRALSNLPVMHTLPLYDAGDICCADGNLETAQRLFAQRVSALLAKGHFPIGLGGGHEMGFASYLGLADHMPSRRIAIVNLDAHFDLRDNSVPNSGTPYLQALRHAGEHGIALDYFCLGISASSNTQRLFRTAEATGSRFMLDEELTEVARAANIERLLNWLEPADAVYLSLCLDVLPSTLAPGVSAPSSRGVPLEVLEPIMAAVAGTGKLQLFDVAELSPPWDRDHATARVAARLIHQLTRNPSHTVVRRWA
jgi:formiminoglutamase